MSKIISVFQIQVLHNVNNFPPKLRGYDLARLEANTGLPWITEYKKTLS